ncbi:hypothetical protein [Flavobacterium sp.]|uniref:hypothetical protein n=1 Tax=Flavobacterium sp. TaxID=239 RepID=UPI0040332F10
MKTHIFLLCIATALLSCKKDLQSVAIDHKTSMVMVDSLPGETTATATPIYQVTCFDNSQVVSRLGTNQFLKELDSVGVFDNVHPTQMAKLSDIHFGALKSLGKNYKLLHVTLGSLFAPGNKDMAIVAYQPDKSYITILIYNDQKGDIRELYRDYNVDNALRNTDCHYGPKNSLDIQLASEIVYRRDYLLKNPKSNLFDDAPCVIGDFTKNENYAPDVGCFSPNAPKVPGNVLSIATSFVYNNWECLKYDKKTDSFLVYYGQEFAD